jgi:hypothetical protein
MTRDAAIPSTCSVVACAASASFQVADVTDPGVGLSAEGAKTGASPEGAGAAPTGTGAGSGNARKSR